MNIPLTLTFDDVLLVPLRSRVRSRGDVETATTFSRHIPLILPVVSANMDTVTESGMAIALAKAGGIGVIHRFMTIERQVEEVMMVKRNQNVVIDEPFTVGLNDTINSVLEKSLRFRCTSFLVADDENHLLGIITRRDIQFVKNFNETVAQLMTPLKKLIVASPNIDLESAKEILREHKIEKLPLIDSENCIRGLITATDILKFTKYPRATKDGRGRLRVAAAIGVKDDYSNRAMALMKAGVDALVVDIAHGHSERALEVILELKGKFPGVDLVGGNIATRQGALDLILAGVDAVKVGIGGGSTCITRIATGVGVPQLSAIMAVASVCREKGVPMIADGGIKNSGDMVKALAAGAETVMIGSLLAGTDETPGQVMTYQNQRYKIYRGMASLTANFVRPDHRQNESADTITPEGIESRVPYKGPVENILNQLVGGLRSGMSYCDAMNISELQHHARFVRMTEAGLGESRNHTNQRV